MVPRVDEPPGRGRGWRRGEGSQPAKGLGMRGGGGCLYVWAMRGRRWAGGEAAATQVVGRAAERREHFCTDFSAKKAGHNDSVRYRSIAQHFPQNKFKKLDRMLNCRLADFPRFFGHTSIGAVLQYGSFRSRSSSLSMRMGPSIHYQRGTLFDNNPL